MGFNVVESREGFVTVRLRHDVPLKFKLGAVRNFSHFF